MNATANDTRAVVMDALTLALRPDVDVQPVNGTDISRGVLDHVDVLVIPGNRRAKIKPSALAQLAHFGGRIVDCLGFDGDCARKSAKR